MRMVSARMRPLLTIAFLLTMGSSSLDCGSLDEGEPCGDSGSHFPATCRSGLSCRSGYCRREALTVGHNLNDYAPVCEGDDLRNCGYAPCRCQRKHSAVAGEPCSEEANCAEELICGGWVDSQTCRERGSVPPGAPCRTNAECADDGLCANYQDGPICAQWGATPLGAPCAESGECESGLRCLPDPHDETLICRPGLLVGATCDADDECASDVCSRGRCWAEPERS